MSSAPVKWLKRGWIPLVYVLLTLAMTWNLGAAMMLALALKDLWLRRATPDSPATGGT